MVDEMREIDGRIVKVIPWGFLTMMERKRKLLKLAQPVIGQLKGLFAEDGGNFGNDELIGIIETVVNTFDEKSFKLFIEMMLDQVTVDNFQMSDPLIRDDQLQASSGMFYKICQYVLEVNYRDFFQMIGLLPSES